MKGGLSPIPFLLIVVGGLMVWSGLKDTSPIALIKGALGSPAPTPPTTGSGTP